MPMSPIPTSNGPVRHGQGLATDNQGIDDMSFKDLTDRAAAAMKPKPEDGATTPKKPTDAKAEDTSGKSESKPS